MTDGVLAWRLGARFIHLVIDEGNEPVSQARMRALGTRLEPFLFRKWPS